MMMKKIAALVSGAMLMSIAGTTFAQEPVPCPTAEMVRSQGTTLTRGFQDTQCNDYLWTFYSAPYQVDPFATWQTHFEENLPNITDPSLAVGKAQQDLNNLALSTYVTSYITSDNVTICEYVPFNTNYKVYAVNHVDVAIKTRK